MSIRCASPFRSTGPVFVALALAVSAGPAAGQSLLAARSLWTERSGSLVTDIRARHAGDIVTILIDERATAEKGAETDLSRDSSFASTLTPPNFTKPKALKEFLLNLQTSGQANSKYTGEGRTSRTDRATATISARIMRVLDNGDLLLEGRRMVKVNDETQTIVVSGVVRPWDIGSDNTVLSSRIADGEVRLEGHGTVSDRQRPGLIQRIFDFLGLY